MIDFSDCAIDTSSKYEGSDQKIGIIYHDSRYMLKLSDRISTEDRNDLNSSYSNSIYKFPNACLTIGRKKVNYFDIMTSGINIDLSNAILRTVPKIDLCKIEDVIDNVEEISDIRKKFYKFILRERYDKILKVAFNKVQKFSNL